MHESKLIKLYILNMCSLLYINYTSLKLFKFFLILMSGINLEAINDVNKVIVINKKYYSSE